MRKNSEVLYKLDSLLTVEKVAELLGVSIRTVRDWVCKRKIPYTKFERRVYISADVIEERLRLAAVGALQGSPGPTLAEQGGAHLAGGEA